MADENITQTENNTPTAEDYAALKAELEAERAKATEMVAEATQPLQDRITELEGQVTTYATDAQAFQEKLDHLNTDFEGAKAAYAYAVEDFKQLAIASNPLVPQEAIYGTTVEEIKASLDRASKLVANVQESLSKQAQAAQVPAGAPQRTGPDVSAMSTKEKINLGLEQARKRKE